MATRDATGEGHEGWIFVGDPTAISFRNNKALSYGLLEMFSLGGSLKSLAPKVNSQTSCC